MVVGSWFNCEHVKKNEMDTLDLVFASPRYNDTNFKFMPSNTKHILHLHMDEKNIIPSYPHLNIMNQIFV